MTDTAFDLTALPGDEGRSDEALNANVCAIAAEMLRARHLDPEELGAALGMAPVTIRAKLRGSRRFTTAELFRMAQYFATTTDVFYRPVEELRAELDRLVQNWKILDGTKAKLSVVPPPPGHELPLEWGAESPSNPHPRNLHIVSQ